ncbi:MAG TPA: nuclear transport factor 2 family protein [Pirellulales bacterium]|nr:nuclear transport factor 2 family protein [Pirellulales bacterium]
MQTKSLFLSLASTLAAATLFGLSTTAAIETQVIDQPKNETQAVQEAVDRFYASLNTLFGGDATAMEQVWSHADDITYMGPVGGYQVGWKQVQAVWEQQAAMKLGGKVEPMATRITLGGELASVQCLEVGNNMTADGQAEKVSIRATSLFRKEEGQWKMISHHTDVLPYLETETDAVLKQLKSE